MSDFLVKRDELRECRIAESEVPAPAAGQALLRVDRFGLTANNITYAVMGEAMSYWDFFPAEAGWGRVPMWGFAEVKRSQDWGRAGLEQRVAEAWHPFCEWTAGWLETIPGEGFDGVRAAYLDVLEGRVAPNAAHVISL